MGGRGGKALGKESTGEKGREGEVAGTFRVEAFVHIRVLLLKPFLAFLRCAAELAILGWWISLLFLARRPKLA